MHSFIFIFGFVQILFLISGASSYVLPYANLDLQVEISIKEVENTNITPNTPRTQADQQCLPTFNFFCYQAEDDKSMCECNKRIAAEESCPESANKYCNEDASECSCWYKTGNRCRPKWDFKCQPAKVLDFDWECTCEGHPEDGKCPNDYQKFCRSSVCGWCSKTSNYKSIFGDNSSSWQ